MALSESTPRALCDLIGEGAVSGYACKKRSLREGIQ